MPSFTGCWKASSRLGPVVPLVCARASTWQAPHFATNSCLPATRLGLPPPGCAEHALSATTVPATASPASAARRPGLESTGPIGAGLYRHDRPPAGGRAFGRLGAPSGTLGHGRQRLQSALR